MAELTVPTLNFSTLGDLGKTYREAQNRRTLADLGQGLADGTIDYRQAAGKIASTGSLGGVVSLLQLAEAKDKLARGEIAAQQFASLITGQPGGASSSAPSPVAAGPTIPNDANAFPGQAGMDARLADRSQDFIQDNPGTYLSSGVRSTADQARLYADRANNPNPVAVPGTSRHERGLAVDIGGMTPEQRAMLPQYGLAQPVANDPPHVELARNTQVASNDPAAIPVNAQATQGFAVPGQEQPSTAGLSRIGVAALGALANPNTPDGIKQAAGLFLKRELDASKPNEKIQMLTQMKQMTGYPGSILDLEKEMKAAGKTEVNINQTGEKEYEKQSAKEFAEMNRKLIEGAQSARMKVSVLTRMGDLLNDPNLYTGAGGEKVLTAKRLAKAIGVDVGDTSSGEAMRAIGNQFALELRNPSGGAGMPGALSDKDREFLQASVPGLEQSREGNAKIIDYMKRVAQRSLDVERLRQDYVKKNGRLNEGFYRELEAYSNANPLFPEAGQQQASPPMQGARQAPDGNWYVQQNGKYYRVEQ